MFRKTSNLVLIAILGGLLLVYAITEFSTNAGRSKNLRQELVSIDPSKATRLSIEKNGEEMKLYKENDQWLGSDGQKDGIEVMSERVSSLLGQLNTIQPSRLVSKKKASWKDYQVDSLGTRVKVYEGESEKLDIVLGRLGNKGGAQQPQQMSFFTYVRLEGDQEVYAADDFMGMSMTTNLNALRNNRLLNINADSLESVQFINAADGAFTLHKKASEWMIDDITADSSSVASYFADIRYLSSQAFEDQLSVADLKAPAAEILYKQKNGEVMTIRVYEQALPKQAKIIHSSMNSNLFSDTVLIDQLFKSKLYFTGEND